MAILFPAGLRLSDADGNPLSGAKIRVRDANTTDLSSLFSDSGLSSGITNPVVTDASGYPANGGNECVINIAAGLYDVAFLTSDDQVIASWDDMVPWGSESGDIERVVTGNGRIKITGAAGAVLIQVGDPSPDDLGGTLTIQGQAGSQLASLTLDAATVNVGTATGALKENGKKLSGTVYTDVTQVTAATQVDIALPEDPANVREYELTIWDYSQSGNASLNARFSYDGGGTFKSGASDYSMLFTTSGGGAVTLAGEDLANDYIQIFSNLNGTTNGKGRLWATIITPDSGNDNTSMDWRGSGYNNLANIYTFHGVGHGLLSYGRATHIRLYVSANTFTFKYRLTVNRGSGEA